MEKSELVPLLESNLARHLHWISAADSKATFTFTLATAMLGLLAAIAPRSLCMWTTISAIFTSFAVVLELTALLFLSLASFPRTEGPKGSLIFCGGISQRSQDQFKEEINELSIELYVSDLIAQCYRNAEIATRKFVLIQRALFCLYLSVLPWGLALWLIYNSNNK